MDVPTVRLPWDNWTSCLSVLLDVQDALDGQQLTVDEAGEYIVFGTYTSSCFGAH